jgi:hypothetical protein
MVGAEVTLSRYSRTKPVLHTRPDHRILDAIPMPGARFGRHRDGATLGTEYEVTKPLPDSVTQGDVAPWFEQPGGGTLFYFDKPIQWYLDNGYLREIH